MKKLCWLDPVSSECVVTDGLWDMVYEGPLADLDAPAEFIMVGSGQQIDPDNLVALCYALGMTPSYLAPQGREEDNIDFAMRIVATCLNFIQTKTR